MKRFSKTQRLTLTSLFLAIGIVLPFSTAHMLGIPGTVLLPMHIPALLCGLLCGPFYGAACGALLPLLNSLLTGMPAIFPMMPIMCAELCTYGLISGLLFRKTPLGSKKWGVYPTLLCSFLCGRLIYGLMFGILFAIKGSLKAPTVLTATVVGIPGMLVQLLLIPAIIFAIFGFNPSKDENAIQSAKNLIDKGKASCVVIKDGKILTIEHGSGIRPILDIYDAGLLSDAVVVDKIVGKAAALIMVLGGVKACFGRTVSKGAVEAFDKHRIPVEYSECPEYIINRAGDGLCPMEEAVRDINDPAAALLAVKEKLDKLTQENKANTEKK